MLCLIIISLYLSPIGWLCELHYFSLKDSQQGRLFPGWPGISASDYMARVGVSLSLRRNPCNEKLAASVRDSQQGRQLAMYFSLAEL